MKTIALRGIGNTGKSTTINLVIDYLSEKYNEKLPIRKRRLRNEMIRVFEINGLIIAIVPAGDSVAILKREINDLEKSYNLTTKSVDYFVCACHKGDTSTYLESISEAVQFHSIWYVDGSNDYGDYVHELQAKGLLNIIEKLGK